MADATRQVYTGCRYCMALCGVEVTVDLATNRAVRVAPIQRFQDGDVIPEVLDLATADYHLPSPTGPAVRLGLVAPGRPSQPDQSREAASANPRSRSRAHVRLLRHHAHCGPARPPSITSLSGQE